jgi:hypothetical protein
MKKLWLVAFGVVSLVLVTATPASAVGAVVMPSSVIPGGSVTVVGTVPIPGCPVPGTVILQGISLWSNPSGFVAGPYDATGHFSVRGRLSPTATFGAHAFLIRCAGRKEPLGPAAGGEIGGPAAGATFTVVALPRTGGAIGPVSDPAAAAIALILIACGLAFALEARRRTDPINPFDVTNSFLP